MPGKGGISLLSNTTKWLVNKIIYSRIWTTVVYLFRRRWWLKVMFTIFFQLLCPAIFCRNELREKVGVKVRFFLGLSQRTRPIFCRKQLREKNRTDFFSDQKSAYTDRLFIGAIVCDNSRRGIIVGWRHSDFYRTEVSAHGPNFCRKQLREKIGAILYQSKSQRTRTDFHSDFLSTIKIWSVCAGIHVA